MAWRWYAEGLDSSGRGDEGHLELDGLAASLSAAETGIGLALTAPQVRTASCIKGAEVSGAQY